MAESVMYNILCLTLLFSAASSLEQMDVNVPSTGICKGGRFRNVNELKQYMPGCVVIVGSLEISIEQAKKKDFNDTPFYNLREITDYLVIYRVRGLESIGQLFPNLTRIRGNRLLNNFGLIVYDNQNLREIGLYSLLKIDRGGVIIWGLPQACFVETIDWKVIAPRARHVINSPDKQIECNIPCSCTLDTATNRCWNNKKCQLYIEGDEAEECEEQCFGCRKTKKNLCFACRHYTHNFTCVPQCPPGSIILPDNKYCITQEICHSLGRLVWNNTCISRCPMDFKMNNDTGTATCEPCTHCEMTCPSLMIQSLGSIQNAERCVYINGSLTIHLRAIADAMRDLKMYLGNIQEVAEYILVEASDVITSLEFLTSLRVIKGKKLKDGRYSLFITENNNLQSLFSPNVTKNLVIENGSVLFENNPALCMNVIDEIKGRFPIPPQELDIPLGSNGYRGGCREVRFNFTIRATSETSVEISFPIDNHNIHYSALYVRMPPGVQSTIVPESCSEFEWHDAEVPAINGRNFSVVELKSLLPASTYAFCVEVYDPQNKILSRSNIVNFTTPVGIPRPPFIFELVASRSDAVVVRWVDHKDYVQHIKYYQLEVAFIEINSNISLIDYCKYSETFFETDEIRHALVMTPPPDYNRGCESMCGVLSSVTPGAMVEEYFDVLEGDDLACHDDEEDFTVQNEVTERNHLRNLKLNISGPRNDFQVEGLSPFSDYKFRLRACVGGKCSKSSRGIVRTLKSEKADIPLVTSADADASGKIVVKWQPPELSNGPILTYVVEVLPRVKINDLLPQAWCMQAHKRETVVKSVIAPKYLVRVCLRTLASSNACSVWKKVLVSNQTDSETPGRHVTPKIDLLWTGVVFGLLIYSASFIVGWFKRKVRIRSDITPLVDATVSLHVESDAPALMLSVPFHTIPLD